MALQRTDELGTSGGQLMQNILTAVIAGLIVHAIIKRLPKS